MSVTELPQPGAPEFERVPPHDVPAEQCVLGGMMLSKDAIADVVESLRGVDFYKPAHQLVYEAALDLYGRGEPADAVTVSAELTKRGELARVGGAPYLHTLISSVPTAANAGYYARIVAERAVLRRLVEAGTRITQMGYRSDGEVDAIVDAAQAEVYSVTDQRTSEDYLPLSEIMEGALDEIESISARDGAMVGVPTGFADLDALTNGFHPGQMVIVAARPAIGKALACDTPLPTPSGWTTMGEVAVGDELIGADGRPTRVVAATETMQARPCYELTFSDGATIVADGSHQWRTEAGPGPASTLAGRLVGRSGGGSGVRTTVEIAATLRGEGSRRYRHAIANTAPLQCPEVALPAAPYAIGVHLATRHLVAAHRLDAAGVRLPCPTTTTAAPGPTRVTPRPDTPTTATPTTATPTTASPTTAVIDTPATPAAGRIPVALLRASPAQRGQLLAGILDAAATVMANGAVHVTTTEPVLAGDLAELVNGLGHTASITARRVAAHGPGAARSTTAHTLTLHPGGEVHRGDEIRRGSEALRAGRRRGGHPGRRAGAAEPPCRYITAVRPVHSVPVRCVQVAAPDAMYLAGRSMIPTHNSTLALDFARSAAVRHGRTAVIFSLEMSRNEITMRLLSAEAKVSLSSMRSGSLTDDDWTRLARRMGEVSDAPLFIDDSPNMTMMEIRAKCRRLRQRHDLRFVIVDYLQLMQSGRRVESRQQEVSEFSRSLKLLAKELGVPVIALSQLNRGPEQRTDKKPMLSDLRESGSLEQDADLVVLMHREDFYDQESPRAGEADLIVAKHRNGPTQTVTVAFQGHYSRFVDMAQG